MQLSELPAKNRLLLVVPTGELKTDVTNFLSNSGLEFELGNRQYNNPVTNMPIDLVHVRAGMVPQFIQDERFSPGVGISGSDLIWEAGMREDEGVALPIKKVNGQAKEWSLYFGMTTRYANQIRATYNRTSQIQDFTGTTIATERPYITSKILKDRHVGSVDIFSVHGTNEAMQYLLPGCEGVMGIDSTGATRKANNLELVETVHYGTVRLINNSDKLTPQQQRIFEDLQERLTVATQKKTRATF